MSQGIFGGGYVRQSISILGGRIHTRCGQEQLPNVKLRLHAGPISSAGNFISPGLSVRSSLRFSGRSASAEPKELLETSCMNAKATPQNPRKTAGAESGQFHGRTEGPGYFGNQGLRD